MELYGVSNQSVHRKLRMCGLAEPNIDYGRTIPWKIRKEHRSQNVLILLRAAARRKLGVDHPMSATRERELDSWLDKLKRADLVVDYGWHIDPAGVKAFGWNYQKRRPGVDRWIIREPDQV